MKLQFSSIISLVWIFLLKEADELKTRPGGGDEEGGFHGKMNYVGKKII
ncbi:hypothetical protein ES702_07323 [subsurface metagenome]